MSERLSPSSWSRAAWRWFLYGYERGVQSGVEIGYAEAMTDFLGMAQELASTSPSKGEPFLARQARISRRHAEGPNLTPEQIRAKAEASWAEREAS